MSIDVIIPVYKPADDFDDVLKKIMAQSVRPDNIILLQTIEDKSEKVKKYSAENIKTYPVLKSEFDHGATRAYGAELSLADYVLFMTQDAVPDNNKLIEELLKAFDDKKVGVAYARQLARKDSDILEKLTRVYNYPDKSMVKKKEDIERLGIKTFFCSDVCAMYKKSLYEELGGFVKKAIFNEDMIMASRIIDNGNYVAYCADAKVIHSHSYTCMQQFHRNFDLGVSQKQYSEVFDRISSEKEGAGFAGKTLKLLLKKGKLFKAFYFCMQCGFKLFGYKLGKNYDKLPKKVVLKCTMNKMYWEK